MSENTKIKNETEQYLTENEIKLEKNYSSDYSETENETYINSEFDSIIVKTEISITDNILDYNFETTSSLDKTAAKSIESVATQPKMLHSDEQFKNESHSIQQELEQSSEKSYECFFCSKIFTTQESRVEHETTHLEEKPFSCNIYEKKFKRKTYLHHFTCKICGKNFKTKRVLLVHEKIHLESKSFKCNLCHKSFRIVSALAQHRLSHSEINPFNPDVCRLKFKRKNILGQHKLKHESAFKCKVCEKIFRNKFELISHASVHSNKINFNCKTCGKLYKRKQDLFHHELIHLNKISFITRVQ